MTAANRRIEGARGMALLSALIVAALAAAIVVAVTQRNQAAIARSSIEQYRFQTSVVVDALEREAMHALTRDRATAPVDSLLDDWAKARLLGSNTLVDARAAISDEQAKFNINNLSLNSRFLTSAAGTDSDTPGAQNTDESLVAPGTEGATAPETGAEASAGPATGAGNQGLIEREITLPGTGRKMTVLDVPLPREMAGTNSADSPTEGAAQDALLGALPTGPASQSAQAATGSTGATPAGATTEPAAKPRATPQMIATARFMLLLNALEIDPAIADAILDWLDEDGETRFPQGAEDDYYSKLDPPYRAANRPLADISELRLVKGVTPEIYAKLEPFLTALPTYVPINVNTAPPEVLMSIAPGIDRATADGVVLQRKVQPFMTLSQLERSGALAGRPLAATGLTVSSNYFAVTTKVREDDQQPAYRFVSLLKRGGPQGLVRIRRQRATDNG